MGIGKANKYKLKETILNSLTLLAALIVSFLCFQKIWDMNKDPDGRADSSTLEEFRTSTIQVKTILLHSKF